VDLAVLLGLSAPCVQVINHFVTFLRLDCFLLDYSGLRVDDGVLRYVDDIKAEHRVPLEFATVVAVRDPHHAVRISFYNPQTQAQEEVLLQTADEEEQRRVLQELQKHIDLLPSHQAGLSTRYDRFQTCRFAPILIHGLPLCS
jgi:hypothetical protein